MKMRAWQVWLRSVLVPALVASAGAVAEAQSYGFTRASETYWAGGGTEGQDNSLPSPNDITHSDSSGWQSSPQSAGSACTIGGASATMTVSQAVSPGGSATASHAGIHEALIGAPLIGQAGSDSGDYSTVVSQLGASGLPPNPTFTISAEVELSWNNSTADHFYETGTYIIRTGEYSYSPIWLIVEKGVNEITWYDYANDVGGTIPTSTTQGTETIPSTLPASGAVGDKFRVETSSGVTGIVNDGIDDGDIYTWKVDVNADLN